MKTYSFTFQDVQGKGFKDDKSMKSAGLLEKITNNLNKDFNQIDSLSENKKIDFDKDINRNSQLYIEKDGKLIDVIQEMKNKNKSLNKITSGDVHKELTKTYGLSSSQANIAIACTNQGSLGAGTDIIIPIVDKIEKIYVAKDDVTTKIVIDGDKIKCENTQAAIFFPPSEGEKQTKIKYELNTIGKVAALDKKYEKEDKIYEISSIDLGKVGENIKEVNVNVDIVSNIHLDLESNTNLKKTEKEIIDKFKDYDNSVSPAGILLNKFVSNQNLNATENKKFDEIRQNNFVKNEIFSDVLIKHIEKEVNNVGKNVSLNEVKKIAATAADKVEKFIGGNIDKKLLRTEIEDVIIKSNKTEKKPNWTRFKEFLKSIFSSQSRDVENVLKEAKKIATNIGNKSGKIEDNTRHHNKKNEIQI